MWLECGSERVSPAQVSESSHGFTSRFNSEFEFRFNSGFEFRFNSGFKSRIGPSTPVSERLRAVEFPTPRHHIRRATRRVRFRRAGVDNACAGGLYTGHTVRRRLGAMARLRSSSLIFGDQPPIAVGGSVLRRLPGRSGKGDLLGFRAVWQV